jgi:hypothetical protein
MHVGDGVMARVTDEEGNERVVKGPAPEVWGDQDELARQQAEERGEVPVTLADKSNAELQQLAKDSEIPGRTNMERNELEGHLRRLGVVEAKGPDPDQWGEDHASGTSNQEGE